MTGPKDLLVRKPISRVDARRSKPTLRRVAALTALLLVIGFAAAVSQRPAQVQAEGSPPGIQPAVQKWMKQREKPQIELNDALVAVVQRRIEQPAVARAACRRLSVAVTVLTAMAAAPQGQVDQLSRVGLDKFQQGAAACLAGDITSAERLVGEGLAARNAVQETLDDTLDGE